MNTFYAVVFVTQTEHYLRKVVVNDVPNPDPGGVASDVLDEHPYALCIILIDQNFKVVNEYRSPELA